MKKKLLGLIKKSDKGTNTILKETYGGLVNQHIGRKYKFGEEHAIIRKAVYMLLNDLKELNVDIAKYQEFLNYYNDVENEKQEVKHTIEDN